VTGGSARSMKTKWERFSTKTQRKGRKRKGINKGIRPQTKHKKSQRLRRKQARKGEKNRGRDRGAPIAKHQP